MVRLPGFLLVVTLTGCATLPDKMHENVRMGDTYDHVEDAMGDPEVMKCSGENGCNMIYKSGKDICEIKVQVGYVTDLSCRSDPNYTSPLSSTLHVIGTILQGAGGGLSHAQDNTYSCTDMGYGNYTCRNQGNTYYCKAYGNQIQCH